MQERRIQSGIDWSKKETDDSQKTVKAGGRPVTFDPKVVSNDAKPLIVTEPIEMEIPATSFGFHIRARDLASALRPHIHEVIKGLPQKHFLKVVPLVKADGSLDGIDVTVVVPEGSA